jgi:hypothetical protein
LLLRASIACLALMGPMSGRRRTAIEGSLGNFGSAVGVTS